MLRGWGLFGKPRYKSFDEEVVGRKLKSSSYRGTMPIDVNKIVGSVNRCQQNNTILINKNSQRYKGIKESMERMYLIPPIKVYNVEDEYYILDGHHRVEAGKEVGRAFLDAEVVEYKYH